jgi:hypothetical protein
MVNDRNPKDQGSCPLCMQPDWCFLVLLLHATRFEWNGRGSITANWAFMHWSVFVLADHSSLPGACWNLAKITCFRGNCALGLNYSSGDWSSSFMIGLHAEPTPESTPIRLHAKWVWCLIFRIPNINHCFEREQNIVCSDLSSSLDNHLGPRAK